MLLNDILQLVVLLDNYTTYVSSNVKIGPEIILRTCESEL